MEKQQTKMMNRRTWIAGITATTLLAASLAACKQEQQGEETGQALPVMVVSSQPVELEETYSLRFADGRMWTSYLKYRAASPAYA